jgi:hypothetical protein
MFVLGIYKQIKLDMSIPKFKEFKIDEAIVAAGFGPSYIQPYSIATGIPNTGYNMQPIVGTVNTAANHIVSEACSYHENDNPEHTGEGYLKEAKHHINEAIDKAYEGYKAGVSEAMVQIAGKDKPSGAKVLASVIVDHLIDKKIVTRAYKKKLDAEIEDIIINSTF